MKLTTRGRYAVTAMFDLALYSQAYPVSLSEVSLRQSISLPYLEQLFGKLRKNGLVVSTRGPGGGYALAKPMAEISISDIIAGVDEPMDATHCGGLENCKGDGPCLTHNLWVGLNHQINGFLESVTLAELMADKAADREFDFAGIKIVQERNKDNGGSEELND